MSCGHHWGSSCGCLIQHHQLSSPRHTHFSLEGVHRVCSSYGEHFPLRVISYEWWEVDESHPCLISQYDIIYDVWNQGLSSTKISSFQWWKLTKYLVYLTFQSKILHTNPYVYKININLKKKKSKKGIHICIVDSSKYEVVKISSTLTSYNRKMLNAH